MNRICLIISLFVLSTIVGARLVLAAHFVHNQEDSDIRLVKRFLKSTKELKYHFQYHFTGTLSPIPKDIESGLKQTFSSCRFLVAKVRGSFDLPYDDYHLILIIDSKSNKVISFVWGEFWVLPPSQSFKHILKGHNAKSKENAINQVKLLAALITSSTNGKIGEATMQEGKVRVELIENNHSFATLEVKVDKHFRFGTLINKRAEGGTWW